MRLRVFRFCYCRARRPIGTRCNDIVLAALRHSAERPLWGDRLQGL